MQNPFWRFSLLLGSVLSFAFILHIGSLFVLEAPLFQDRIVLSYLINAAMALAVFSLLYKLRHTHQEKLGFLFMASSLVKFILFFILFYRPYNADGDVSRMEFMAFFVPYAISLVLEIIALSKLFNKLT